MASRALQDTVIDDSDEQCPLCVEEFDLTDKNFKPCPCGYQVCQFCFNNIRTNMNGLCPACRRPYDEKTIEFKTVSPEEFKADMALKARKQIAAKQKEAEKRQNESLNRKNLAGLRVVQKNLVYVTGLNLNPRQKEDELLKVLRGPEFFGQYGKIIKIVVSKLKEGATSHNVGVYVTFARKEDAETCIAAVDGSTNGDRVLRAQFGTTKYCSAFLRNEQCNNRNCMFLHETGEDSDSFSRQDLSSMNASQRPSQPGPSQPSHSHPQGPPHQAAQPIVATSQPMHRQGSKDEPGSRSGSADASALPSSASWANKDVQANLNRRTSLAASRSTPSPKAGNASVVNQKSEESKREEPSTRAKEKQPAYPASVPSEAGPSQPPSRKSSVDKSDNAVALLNRLLKDAGSSEFKFVFSANALGADDLRALEDHPCFIDSQGGVKRRLKREKDEAARAKEDDDRAKREAEVQNIQQATAMVEDENLEGGSLQLGGEPEERQDPRSAAGGRISEPQSAIQPPSQYGMVGSPMHLNQSFSNLNINGRSLTPQQLMLLKASNQSGGSNDQFQPFGGLGFDQGDSNRGLFQHQVPHAGTQGHVRHSSRFSFGDSTNKNGNARGINHQPSMMQSNPQQNPLGSHMYSSGVQHPPPGLKTAGTPPISGGGMFGQGHGFTSASIPLGLGGNFNKDSNADLIREMQQGRGHLGGHGIGQSHDTSKLDLADPSILRARTHQGGAGAGQGLYGGQGQVDADFPPLEPPSKPLTNRTHESLIAASHARLQREGVQSTPPVPPGLGLPHGHPSPGYVGDSRPSSRSATPSQTKKGIHGSGIAPVVPTVPIGPARPGTPMKSAIGESRKSVTAKGKESDAKQSVEDTLAGKTTPAVSTGGMGTSSGGETEMPTHSQEGPDQREVSGEKKVPSTGEHPSRPIPKRLNIPDNTKVQEIKNETSSSAGNDPNQCGHGTAGGAISGTVSRPDTPTTSTPASRPSDSPAPRQPRTIRVLPTPKFEAAPSVPPSTTSATSVVSSGQNSVQQPTASKQRSRQPSLTSMSGPATPVAELVSDNLSVASASGSRPGTPPTSSTIVGTAPTRHLSKNQAKKERQAKAKQAEASKKLEEETTKDASENVVQEPIIGRHKKKKRNLTTGTTEESTPDISRPSSPPLQDAPKSSKPDEKTGLSKAKPTAAEQDVESPGPVDYNARLHPTPVDATSENKTLAQMTHELIAEGIISREHPFFRSPPSLSHRYDVGPRDYEEAQRAANTVLTAAQKQALVDGQPVRIRTESGKQMGRILITARGSVFRGFSDEVEERVLCLEKSIAETPSHETFHYTSSSSTSRPEASSFSASTLSSPFLSSESAFSLNDRGYSSGMREAASGVPNLSFGFQDEDLLAHSQGGEDVGLDKKVEELRLALEASKKETESYGKKLEGFIKKNKRTLQI